VRKKYLLALAGITAMVAVVILTLAQVRSVRSGPQASTPTPRYNANTSQLNSNGTNVLPPRPTAVQPKITDLAPNIPYEDKPSVVVQHADGTKERYLLPPGTVDAFIQNLPKGDKFLGDIPAPSALGNPEPPISTEVP
jgi:hypothetical protein